MFLGYNTNGFAHHRLEDALQIIAELGYGGVALTLDYHALNPFETNIAERCDAMGELLQRLRLRTVIETGARFLLDPRRKHQPTLISPEAHQREQRLDFLCRAVDIGATLGSDAISFWSGTACDDAGTATHLDRLVQGCRRLSYYAAERNIRLAFEPEPGMLIDAMPRFAELFERVSHPTFGLTLDVGHLHCQGETPIADHILRWRHVLWNLHIEDMRRGVHDHLQFGEGEMEFPPIFHALHQIDYHGGVYVELSRHSHNAVETARKSIAFLRECNRAK